jgi:hypothetical protein
MNVGIGVGVGIVGVACDLCVSRGNEQLLYLSDRLCPS